jgi:hypothetical protein
MAKTWVLDTETKGTGAHVAPLKREVRAAPQPLNLVRLHPPGTPRESPHADEGAPAAQPKRFKVVDVFSGSVLAEDVTVSAAVSALAGARKVMDVLVYVRDVPSARWRLLSLADTKALWELRERAQRREP